MVLWGVTMGDLHTGRKPLPLSACGAPVWAAEERSPDGAPPVRLQGDVQPDVVLLGRRPHTSPHVPLPGPGPGQDVDEPRGGEWGQNEEHREVLGSDYTCM